ncbi:MAG: VWA domain-containing protein [Planctomycetes bacterium]|nr:VWA domain-containing protein [Planctomycetota bacterium]
MGLLFPGMLLGLVGLAIPVALHLIARHKYQVQEFPSIQLLRADERTNVFAMRLVDVGQLLLRLAVLALLVLAMARLFTGWAPFGRAARNLVVVVDCSASMRALGTGADGRRAPLVALAKAKAEALLRAIAAPSQCALIAAGQDAESVVPLQPSPQRALHALSGLDAADGAGRGLVRAVATACGLVWGRREARSQIVVLTDLAASAFETRNSDDLRVVQDAQRELGRKLDIVFLDLAGGQADNLAVLDAGVRGLRAKMGDDARIVARVFNSGAAERKAKLQLAVGERREPAVREIALPPGGEADVGLTLRASRAGQAMVEVRLDGDDGLPADNRFAVPLDVADARRVLIVSGAGATGETPVPPKGTEVGGTGILPVTAKSEQEPTLDGVRILRFALNPGRELGQPHGTGIHTTAVAPEALAAQPLSKYDAIVLHGVSTLGEQALRDLDTFVRQGRAVLFVCSADTNAMKFSRTFAALSPAEVGNERALDPPIGIRHADSQHPVLAPFRDRLKGDLTAVRFAALRELRRLAPDARAMFLGTDGSVLAAEMPVGQGRTALLAFGFELERGSLARTRVFPALMWQLVGYLAGELRPRRPDLLTAARPAVLDVSEPGFAFLDQLELAPLASSEPPMRLAVGRDRTLLVPGLPVGNYLVQKPSVGAGRRAAGGRLLAVNHDPRESRTVRIAESELAGLFGQSMRVATVAEPLELELPGGELWPLLVLLLIAAYAVEGGVGWLLNARRERQRTEGAGQ